MAQNLDKNLENIKELSRAAMEAIEILKQKQQSDFKSLWVITYLAIIAIAVLIIYTSSAP